MVEKKPQRIAMKAGSKEQFLIAECRWDAELP